jgi:hypothetical protein
MKKTLLAVAILIGSSCAAQIGVVTLKKRDKLVPVAQWYTMQNRGLQHNVFFYADKETVLAKLNSMLEEEDLFFEEFKLDEVDSKYWEVEKENGWHSTIYLIQDSETEGYFWINVVTPFE